MSGPMTTGEILSMLERKCPALMKRIGTNVCTDEVYELVRLVERYDEQRVRTGASKELTP